MRRIFCLALLLLSDGTSVSAWAKTPFTREIVAHDSVRIEVLAQGHGPLIVFYPSLGRSGRDYDAVAARLVADGFRVLRPEPRGIGRSQGPMTGLTIHDLAADLAAVVVHEKQGPAILVGHAFGNFVVRMVATDRPDLVRGLVMAAASAGKVPPGSTEKPIGTDIRKAIDGAGDLTLPEAQRLDDLRIAFFAPGNDPKVWLGGWYPKVLEMEGHARDVTPVDEYFAGGTAPILDLQAEDDTVAPRRFANVMKSMLGDRVSITVIPHAGHALAPEQPVAMADAITAFARGIEGSNRL
jgi:pimeloyl-ACP methyl ester carboxylesterase